MPAPLRWDNSIVPSVRNFYGKGVTPPSKRVSSAPKSRPESRTETGQYRPGTAEERLRTQPSRSLLASGKRHERPANGESPKYTIQRFGADGYCQTIGSREIPIIPATRIKPAMVRNERPVDPMLPFYKLATEAYEENEVLKCPIPINQVNVQGLRQESLLTREPSVTYGCFNINIPTGNMDDGSILNKRAPEQGFLEECYSPSIQGEEENEAQGVQKLNSELKFAVHTRINGWKLSSGKKQFIEHAFPDSREVPKAIRKRISKRSNAAFRQDVHRKRTVVNSKWDLNELRRDMQARANKSIQDERQRREMLQHTLPESVQRLDSLKPFTSEDPHERISGGKRFRQSKRARTPSLLRSTSRNSQSYTATAAEEQELYLAYLQNRQYH